MSTTQASFTPGVGADIDSLCSKCGDVRHVILTHKDGLVDRCECKECGRKHKFKTKDPEVLEQIKAFKKAQKALASGKSTTASPAKKKRTRKTSPKIEPIVIDQELPVLNYSPKRMFQLNDQIEHTKFGTGIVYEIADSNKMVVHFVEQGPKTLLFGRD